MYTCLWGKYAVPRFLFGTTLDLDEEDRLHQAVRCATAQPNRPTTPHRIVSRWCTVLSCLSRPSACLFACLPTSCLPVPSVVRIPRYEWSRHISTPCASNVDGRHGSKVRPACTRKKSGRYTSELDAEPEETVEYRHLAGAKT